MTIRLLIVDDQELIRTGFRLFLQTQNDLEVVGEADDGHGALAQAAALRPDVVLMDIRMPRMDGVEATSRLTASDSPPRVLILTTYDLDEYVFGALRAGPARVEEVIRSEDELRPWQTFLAQPAQHGRPREQQLRRFLSTKKGRKIRYGSLLVEALDGGRPPAPLADLLAGL